MDPKELILSLLDPHLIPDLAKMVLDYCEMCELCGQYDHLHAILKVDLVDSKEFRENKIVNNEELEFAVCEQCVNLDKTTMRNRLKRVIRSSEPYEIISIHYCDIEPTIINGTHTPTSVEINISSPLKWTAPKRKILSFC